MKLKRLGFTLLAILFCMIGIMQSPVFATTEIQLASGIIDPNDYAPGSINDAFNDTEEIVNIASTIIAVIRTVGVVVTVIALLVMGIKYMTGSIEEKADYKKSMIPYLIGVFIFFALSQIIAIIMDLTSQINQ